MYKTPLQQFIRFLVVGGLNTFVDFATLNLLILIFGLVSGDPKYIYFKIISYTLASFNSFILNKFWVFKHNEHQENQNLATNLAANLGREIRNFTITSGIGLVLNSLISLVVFHSLHAYWPSISPMALANAGAVAGTGIVLLFNFFSYKFVVFKKKQVQVPVSIN